jgi:hypothetical protein
MDKCITEEAFLKCECERCKRNRDSMVSQTVNTIIIGIIRQSIDDIFKKEKQ